MKRHMGGWAFPPPRSPFLKPGALPTSEVPAQGQGCPQTGQHRWWCGVGPAGPVGREAGRSRVPQHWKGCEAPGPALERGDSSDPRGTLPPPPPDSLSQLRWVGVSRSHLLGSPCSRRPGIPSAGDALGTQVRASGSGTWSVYAYLYTSLGTGTSVYKYLWFGAPVYTSLLSGMCPTACEQTCQLH